MILANTAILLVDHVGRGRTFETQELIAHAGFFVAGYLLIDATSGLEVLRVVTSKLAFWKKAP